MYFCQYSCCLDRDGFLALLTAPSSLTSLPPCLQFLSCSLKVVCQLLSSNSTTKCFECFVSVVIFMFPSTFLTLLFYFLIILYFIGEILVSLRMLIWYLLVLLGSMYYLSSELFLSVFLFHLGGFPQISSYLLTVHI